MSGEGPQSTPKLATKSKPLAATHDGTEEGMGSARIAVADRIADLLRGPLTRAVKVTVEETLRAEVGPKLEELWFRFEAQLAEHVFRMSIDKDARVLSLEQAAELLNVPESWVSTWTREGKLPAVRIGKHLRWTQGALEAWIIEQARRETKKWKAQEAEAYRRAG